MITYDPNDIKPGWIAFFVVLALVVATFLLWRSMNTQLGKIRVPPRASFDHNGSGSADARDESPGSDPGAGSTRQSSDPPDDDPPVAP